MPLFHTVAGSIAQAAEQFARMLRADKAQSHIGKIQLRGKRLVKMRSGERLVKLVDGQVIRRSFVFDNVFQPEDFRDLFFNHDFRAFFDYEKVDTQKLNVK